MNLKNVFHFLFIVFAPFTTYLYTLESHNNHENEQATWSRFDPRLISQEEIIELMAQAHKDDESFFATTQDLEEIRAINAPKDWTLIVYIAADNDLYPFAWKNIKQLEQVGSNEHLNIVVQLNTPGSTTPTKRYLVKKGRRILIQDNNQTLSKLNSGSPQTLIDCARWAVQHYPANHYAMVFWNHGSAAIDPIFTKTINPCDLFYCDPIDHMLKIDRGISYMTLLSQLTQNKWYVSDKRGICFDDNFKSYINNTELDFALSEIYNNILNKKKLDLVIFDACLMSMIEISSIIQKYANYMAASEEVVYGTGQNYDLMLRPFLQGSISPRDFAKHVVLAYEQTYQKIINDYTFSALDLSIEPLLEANIDHVANLLKEALTYQINHSVSNMLRKCKSTQFCTCFDEPSYIDIGDFYLNLLRHLQHISLKNKQQESVLQNELAQLLKEGLNIIQNLTIQNRTGQKLQRAQGLSIYFPEHSIATNYLKSPFAICNSWSQLLMRYVFN
ncbi:hypothetical protein KAZ82_00825 [Candidatus Babeliales bacterium]|nr:hypothetical protein [Candidatus Babeliales bacterium]